MHACYASVRSVDKHACCCAFFTLWVGMFVREMLFRWSRCAARNWKKIVFQENPEYYDKFLKDDDDGRSNHICIYSDMCERTSIRNVACCMLQACVGMQRLGTLKKAVRVIMLWFWSKYHEFLFWLCFFAQRRMMRPKEKQRRKRMLKRKKEFGKMQPETTGCDCFACINCWVESMCIVPPIRMHFWCGQRTKGYDEWRVCLCIFGTSWMHVHAYFTSAYV